MRERPLCFSGLDHIPQPSGCWIFFSAPNMVFLPFQRGTAVTEARETDGAKPRL
jgi:hypothetical protein